MTNIPLKPFYMIRHGESEMNAQGVYSGQIDTPLTEKGRQQAQDAEKILSVVTPIPDIIFHSDLSRARDTASYLNKTLQLEMIEIPEIGEHNVGEWQGKESKYLRERILKGENPPGGESLDVFNARVAKGFTQALSHEASLPLIVCHGGVFRGFAANFNFRMTGIENCVLYKFEPAPDRARKWAMTVYSEEGAAPFEIAA